MPDWKSKDSSDRLLAALVASLGDQKLDYRKIASYYGGTATYDSVEGRFRTIKKEASKMKQEIASGVRPEAPARGTASANTTPRRPKPQRPADSVLNGRVSKSANTTPSRKRPIAPIKNELFDSASSSAVSNDNDPEVDGEGMMAASDFSAAMSFAGQGDDSFVDPVMSMMMDDSNFWEERDAV